MGGHFHYAQYRINEIIEEVERRIENNESTEKDEYGDEIGDHFSNETIEKFKEALVTLKKSEAMAHRIDWLISGDDGEESFHERWDEELAKLET